MAQDNIIALNEGNYADVTSTPGMLVLVDFWAVWCGPCRAVAPVLEKLASDYSDKLIVGKLNVDENQQLAGRFGITSIPTILVYKEGDIVDTLVGSRPYQDFKTVVDRYI